MRGVVGVILAAGEGTRMKSSTPKVLFTICGKTMVEAVLDTALELKLEKILLVIGHKGELIRDYLATNKKYAEIEIVWQKQQLGSGHAVLQTQSLLKNWKEDVLVLCADTPLLTPLTLEKLIKTHRQKKNIVTILTAQLDNPYGYGRIIRDKTNQIIRITEEKDAISMERQIKEINTGIYCFQTKALFRVLKKITPDNKKKEYYLTDVIELLRTGKAKIGSLTCDNWQETMGINDRTQLAEAIAILNKRKLDSLMKEGVTILDPASVFIDQQVEVGRDSLILPGTIIQGQTRIGENCALGPQSFIKNCLIGNEVEIRASFVYGAEIANKVKIGPFSHLRPKAVIGEQVRIGNFVEIKQSQIAKGTKVSHLSYVGDSILGTNINIGAGVITCNFDGVKKNQTLIEDNVFVGSNVNLVAPIKVGEGAIIGAGSTITEDVPPHSLAIARSRQLNKENWVLNKKQQTPT